MEKTQFQLNTVFGFVFFTKGCYRNLVKLSLPVKPVFTWLPSQIWWSQRGEWCPGSGHSVWWDQHRLQETGKEQLICLPLSDLTFNWITWNGQHRIYSSSVVSKLHLCRMRLLCLWLHIVCFDDRCLLARFNEITIIIVETNTISHFI